MKCHNYRLIMPIVMLFSMISCATLEGGELFREVVSKGELPSYITNGECPATIYKIEDGVGVYACDLNRLKDLPQSEYEKGKTYNLVCYDKQDFLSSNTAIGLPANRYKFSADLVGEYMPSIYSGTMILKGRKLNLDLQKITANFTINILNAPVDFKDGLILFQDGIQDVFYPMDKTGKPSPHFDTQKYHSQKLAFSTDKIVSSLLPMTTESWIPVIKLNFTDQVCEIAPKLNYTLHSAESGEITIDFATYKKNNTVKLTYTVKNNTGTKIHSQSEQFLLSDNTSQTSQNIHYDVLVQDAQGWNTVKVYDALCSDADKHGAIWNDWGNDKQLRDTMSFCIIEQSNPGPINIRVKKKVGSFSKVEIRPSVWNITSRNLGDGIIEFTLPNIQHGKVSVEFDGDRQHNLFIIANTPDSNKPSANDPNVIYFGPGEHDRQVIRLGDNQTLYLDYGAVLYSLVEVVGNNCKIAGHGILSGDKMRHWGGTTWSNGDIIFKCNPGRTMQRSGLEIKDITIVNGPSWNVAIWNFDNVLVDGINIIDWGLNGDGIDLINCRNVEVKNCLIRTYDDCITIKLRHNNPQDGIFTDMCNADIHHNLIWNDYARGIVVGPEAGNQQCGTGYIHDIDIHDCIFLQHKRGQFTDDLRGAFTIGQMSSPEDGTPTKIENIHAWNLIFDSIDHTGRNVWLHQYKSPGTCTMSNILLENFQILDAKSVITPAVRISTNNHEIRGLKMRNITKDGQKITSQGKELEIIGNVDYTIE